jgi:hypothetical protein
MGFSMNLGVINSLSVVSYKVKLTEGTQTQRYMNVLNIQ